MSSSSSDTAIQADVARELIAGEAQFDFAFLIMNALAAVIASYALLADSASGVIGAMLVAMLLGPIEGISLALVDGDTRLLRQASFSLVVGISTVVCCAAVIGWLHADIPAGKELLARTRPNYLDLMIALADGAVGAYAAMRPKISNAVVGVAIATALVPPMCTGTIFLTRGEWDSAAGGYLLAFANIVAIQFASSVVMWLSGLHRGMDGLLGRARMVWFNLASLVLLVVLFVVLGWNTKLLVSEVIFQSNVRKNLQNELTHFLGARLADTQITREDDRFIVRAVVRGPYPLSARDVGSLEAALPRPVDGLPLELRVRFVKVEVMSAAGPVYDQHFTESEALRQNAVVIKPGVDDERVPSTDTESGNLPL